jgi:hypothetical protein
MRFDTKIAVVVLGDLPTWQQLNVVAFTASGLAASEPGVMGEPYRDASDHTYPPMFREPVLVFEADSEHLRKAWDRAMAAGLRPALFTRDLFATDHDEANRAAVRAVAEGDLDLVGFALRAERGRVDKVVKGLKLHG